VDEDAESDSEDERGGKRRVAITRERLRSGKDREKEKEKENKAAVKEKAEVVVRLNGFAVKSTGGVKEQTEEWPLELAVGSNTVEVVGEKGGEPWRLYLERQSGA
jgi:hypothetical protein